MGLSFSQIIKKIVLIIIFERSGGNKGAGEVTLLNSSRKNGERGINIKNFWDGE